MTGGAISRCVGLPAVQVTSGCLLWQLPRSLPPGKVSEASRSQVSPVLVPAVGLQPQAVAPEATAYSVGSVVFLRTLNSLLTLRNW